MVRGLGLLAAEKYSTAFLNLSILSSVRDCTRNISQIYFYSVKMLPVSSYYFCSAFLFVTQHQCEQELVLMQVLTCI